MRLVVAGAIGFLALQLVPLGRVASPAVTREAPWPSEPARDLAVAACSDCHSNEPRLEWFDRIAPGSWLVARHVRDGRRQVNFSEWDRRQESDDYAESVEDGEMPMATYTWLHPSANLTDEERRTLVAALEQLPEAGEGDAGGDNSGRGRGRGRGGR